MLLYIIHRTVFILKSSSTENYSPTNNGFFRLILISIISKTINRPVVIFF